MPSEDGDARRPSLLGVLDAGSQAPRPWSITPSYQDYVSALFTQASNLANFNDSQHGQGHIPQTAPRQDYHTQLEAAQPDSLIDWLNLEYVGEVDDSLCCEICTAPFNKPVISKCCSHTFCESCLAQHCSTTIAQNHQVVCPMCRFTRTLCPGLPAVPWKLLAHTNRVAVGLLEKIQVKCPDPSGLCKWIGQRSTVEEHVRDNCKFKEVPCGVSSCNKTIRRSAAKAGKCLHKYKDCKACGQKIELSQMQQHTNTSCPMTSAPCEACGSKFNRRQLDAHTDACWNHKILCKHSEVGCQTQETRRTIQHHETTCVYGLLHLQKQRQTSRIERLERDNKQLQIGLQLQVSKLEAAEDRLERLERRLQEVTQQRAANAHTSGYLPYTCVAGIPAPSILPGTQAYAVNASMSALHHGLAMSQAHSQHGPFIQGASGLPLAYLVPPTPVQTEEYEVGEYEPTEVAAQRPASQVQNELTERVIARPQDGQHPVQDDISGSETYKETDGVAHSVADPPPAFQETGSEDMPMFVWPPRANL